MAFLVDNFSGQPFEGKGQEILLDYVARTDGQPVYVGFAESGTLTSDDTWKIMKMTYDGNNQLTSRKWALDANRKVTFSQVWDNRAVLVYE